MEGNRDQAGQSAPQGQGNENVLLQILAAIQGLTQASLATQTAVQNMVQKLAGNGVTSTTADPSETPEGDQGSAQERVGLRDTAVRLDGPDPVPAVGVQIVGDSEKFTVEKFRKNEAEVFVGVKTLSKLKVG